MRCRKFSFFTVYLHFEFDRFFTPVAVRRLRNFFQLINHIIFKFTHMRRVMLQIFVSQPCSSRKSGCPRHIVCSGAHSFLLSSAQNLRNHLCFAAYIYKSGAFRSVNFVRAHTQHIYVKLFRMDFIFSESLNCINMKKNVRIAFFY